MAAVVLNVTIPDGKVAYAKGLAEAIAKREGLLRPNESFTNAQAKDFLERECRRQLVRLARQIYGEAAGNAAREEANTLAKTMFD